MRERPFNSRRYGSRQERRFLVLFFVLLYTLGGALIWFFYGRNAAFLGWACMTIGMLFVVIVYGIVWLMGKWAGEE